ncbi:hypothetical protein Micbo1qcDRAFT_237133 [Microdochium bolleyi]|uniref:Uncharacterized protein n=1 Tax=Microdochium bolleyi TaxID=196109 RepID=A0A136IMN4_9PEZI|nr:hypothetical protein Micbo1qcDRAFT_237133 [Microdochium bolleyi]
MTHHHHSLPGPKQQLQQQKLPDLSATPLRHPDCCLSLSTTLLSQIAAACATTERDDSQSSTHQQQPRQQPGRRVRDRVILSIGSGSGLLEACLQRYIDSDTTTRTTTNTRGDASEGNTDGRLVVRGVEVHQLSSNSNSNSNTGSQQQMLLNRYLPAHRRSTVRGTWEVSTELEELLLPSSAGGAKRRRGGMATDGGRDRDDDDDDGSGNDDEEQLAQLDRGVDAARVVAESEHFRPGEDSDTGGAGGEEEVAALMFVYPRQPGLVRRYVDAVLAPPSSGARGRRGPRVMIWLGPRADWADFRPCFEAGQPRGGADDGDDKDSEHGVVRSTRVLEGSEAGLLDYEMMSIVYLT